MEWIDVDCISFVKFIGISTILMLLYYLLYAKQATFLQCRVFLLSIIIVSGIITISEIKIYPGKVHAIEIERNDTAEERVTYDSESNNPVAIVPPNTNIETDDSHSDTTVSRFKERLSQFDILMIVYFTVVSLLFIRYFYQLYKIVDITRWGSSSYEDGVRIVRNNRVSSPFSFFKNIYFNRKLEGETMSVVLQHERCHIEHRHYIDATIIELLSIVVWFNPLVWIIKHELRDIHEFQVDHSLINGGIEVTKYQNILFAELMGYSPNIANGFHNSLIKKRFIMMNNKRDIKNSKLRKVLILPSIVGIFILFSFTSKDDVTQYVEKPTLPSEMIATPTTTMIDSVSLFDTLSNSLGAAALGTVRDIDLQKVPFSVIDSFSKSMTATIHKFSKDVRRYTGSDSINIPETLTIQRDTKRTTNPNDIYFDLQPDQVVVSNWSGNSHPNSIKYIQQKDGKTLVTIVCSMVYDRQWTYFSPETVIRDISTGEEYRITGLTGGFPLGKRLVVSGQNRRKVEFTMEFPSLKPSTTHIDLIERLPDHYKTFSNQGTPWYWPNLELDSYKPVNYNYNYLTDSQTPTIKLAGKKDIHLLSVIRTDTTTLVTYATEIYFDSQWIYFSDGWVLRDCKTHQKYFIKRVERAIPLNRVSVVSNKKGQFVTYTMVFPRIPDDIEKIDIMKVPSPNDVPIPRNQQKTCWFGIYVKNNNFYPNGSNTVSNDRYSHPAEEMITEISSKEKPRMTLKIANKRLTRLQIKLTKDEVFILPRDFAIRDVVSGQLYKAIEVWPANFDITTFGKKGDIINIKFDNLTYGVDRIDIGVFTKTGKQDHPWSYQNIEINN